MQELLNIKVVGVRNLNRLQFSFSHSSQPASCRFNQAAAARERQVIPSLDEVLVVQWRSQESHVLTLSGSHVAATV